MWARAASLAALSAAVVTVGCGGGGRPSATVTGSVKHKGQLVKGGDLFFVYADGQTQTAIHPDGTYQFADIAPGEVKVYVMNEAFNPDQRPPSYAKEGSRYGSKAANDRYAEYNKAVGGGQHAQEPAAGGGLPAAEKERLGKLYVKLPKKYTDAKTTDLKFTVTGGNQQKDIEIPD